MAKEQPQISAYWQKRFLLIEEFEKQSADAVIGALFNEYEATLKALNKELTYWYNRLSLNNRLTGSDALIQAKKLLTDNELEEFQWSLSEYIKHASDKQTAVKFSRQIENASARAHINRIDSLRMQAEAHISYLTAVQTSVVGKMIGDVYTDTFYRTAFEIQRAAGIFEPFATIDAYAVKQAIERPWSADGLRFSDRIWKNQEALRIKLDTALTQNIIRGEAPDKLINEISKEFGVSKNQAARLVQTERSAAMARADYECYKDTGVEYYQILATLDNLTSEICRGMDLKIFRLPEYEIGVTAPPFHPNCRTVTVPYDEDFDIGERIAKDNEGNNYYVPGDMKYEEWKEKYVR